MDSGRVGWKGRRFAENQPAGSAEADGGRDDDSNHGGELEAILKEGNASGQGDAATEANGDGQGVAQGVSGELADQSGFGGVIEGDATIEREVPDQRHQDR